MTPSHNALLSLPLSLALALFACRRPAQPKDRLAEAGEKESAATKRQENKGEVAEGATPDRIALDEEALRSLKLSIAPAEVKPLAPALQVSAELVPDPDRRGDVGARAPGRIVAFRIKVGDQVERGAPLVVLESAEVGRARADLTVAEARAEVARQAGAREQSLLEAKATSQREAQEAEAARRTAEAELGAARARLAALGASPDAAPGEDPSRTVLRSPLRATVVARAGYAGKSVAPGDTLVQLVDLDALWLEAQVYERELRFLARGQPVQLEARALPGEVFRGRVDHVGDTLDEKTRAAAVRVLLPNPGHRLKPGMFATARILGTSAHAARSMLVIPWAAVQEVDGHPSVFVREGERAFALRRIHTGERAGDEVEVLNGVRAGDEVVGEGSFILKGELLKATLGEEE